MDDNAINNLREALRYSPDNVPLKHHLAVTLTQASRLDEAETEYTELVKMTGDARYQTGLANVFYLNGAYSKCSVLLEYLISLVASDFDTIILIQT